MKLFRRRRRFEEDMDEELRFHIEAYAADLFRSGLNYEEAVRRARIEFGSVEAKKEECRVAWGLQRLDEIRADLRLTFRTMARNPGFAAIGILSLALGIGANTAIFGVFDAVMLRLLPVRDPGRLVFVQVSGTAGHDGPPYPCFELLRDYAKSFEALAAYSPSAIEFTADRNRELVRGVWVSGNFYETLGVRALIGRTLTARDDQTVGKGGPDGAAAVISHAFWQQRFGGDPTVVGRAVQLFEHSVTIVGVLPTEIMSLEPGRPVDIAIPMMLSDPAIMRDRSSLWLTAVGRLKPGVRAEQARAEVEGLFQGYMADVKVSDQLRKMLFQHMDLAPAGPGAAGLRIRFSKPLTVLMILAGLVLLASCVNVASLMMARATARQRDFAVRMAIGAGRGRLIRQTLTEALVLVGSGGALGIVLARVGEAALGAFFAGGGDNIVLDVSLNYRVVLFTLAVALVSGLAMGIAPAIRAASLDPAAGLQGGSRSIAGSRGSTTIGRTLVVVQVALSIVLLAGAGLFIRSLQGLESVDLGFQREGILTMEVTPERQLFGTPEWLSMQTKILDQVRRAPGVRSASFATMSPLSGRDRGAVVDVLGFRPRVETDKHIHLAAISPDYFETLGVKLLLGRGFTERDGAGAAKVAMLNETAARFYFGNASAIGRKVRFTNYPKSDLVYEVAGVVKDFKHDGIREPAARFIYLPIPQSVDRINRLALTVRVSGVPIAFAEPLRREIQRAHSTLLITSVSTMEKQVEQVLLRERLVAALSSTFGAVALVLASIGLYGILAYAVTRRTNEIGIRMALGATRSGVVWLVLREALALAAGGIVISIPAVLALAGVTQALLYGVKPFDPGVFAGAAFLQLVLTVVAAIVPGRRASRLDATLALRRE
jgi:predicted permease